MSSRSIRSSSSRSASHSTISERRGTAKSSRTSRSSSEMIAMIRVARAQDVEVVGDPAGELLELVGHLLDPERGQPLQPQVEDGAGLDLGEEVGAVLADPVRRVVDQRDVGRDVRRRPARGSSAARAPRPGRRRRGSSRPPRRRWRPRPRGRRGCARARGPGAARRRCGGRPPPRGRRRSRSRKSRRSSCSGRPPFSASMLQPKLVCSGVKRKSWFSTTSGVASRRSSMTTRTPKRSLSSWTWAMPSILLSRASSAMRSTIVALFTW